MSYRSSLVNSKLPRRNQARTFQRSTALKYKYLPEPSNRNQMILKEAINSEEKLAKLWHQKSASHTFGVLPKQNRRSNSTDVTNSRLNYEIASNLMMLPRKTHRSYALNPYKVLKTRVRNCSYDPILGLEKKYPTPLGKFRVFGSIDTDFYKSLGFFRQPTFNKLRN